MTQRLPLFPLGTVLFPGLVLPLTVFEDRYRHLVRYLMELPDGTPREFGVVAIEQGLEVLPPTTGGVVHSEVSLHNVGCVAQLRQVTEHTDGHFEIVSVGDRRFRITGLVADPAPYPVASVEWFPEPEPTSEADELTPLVLATFREYLEVLRGGHQDQLPDNPTVLSHLIAATAALTVADRQALLATPDTVTRLHEELRLLQRETTLLRHVRAIPLAPGELDQRYSVN